MISVRQHADAVKAVLATTGLPVGDTGAPDAEPPYLVLFPLDQGPPSGPIGDPDADWDLRYQVTGVGRGPGPHRQGTSGIDQARWALDEAATALATVPIVVPGRSIARTRPTGGGPDGIDRDVTPPVSFTTARWSVLSVPA